MKIYTGTGDDGSTSLAGGKRLKKSNLQIEAYGTIDELNSVVGLAIEEIRHTKVESTSDRTVLLAHLKCIQEWLFMVGGILSMPADNFDNYLRSIELRSTIKELEEWIDNYSESLPELHGFILPRGSKCSVLLHLARTVCRRGERCICRFIEQNGISSELFPPVQIFVNRLSDFFFISARKMLQMEKIDETIWKSKK